MLQLGAALLREVCAALSDEWGGQLHLSRLCRVCKLTFEPAADCLWHDISSLVVLAYLLPPDAWRAERNPDGPSSISFSRPLVPSDFERFQLYLHRVRVLGMGRCVSIPRTLSRSALEELRKAVPVSCRFSNLHAMSFDSDHALFATKTVNSHLDHLIFAPDITHVRDAEILEILQILPERFPKLSRLTLCYFWAPKSFADTLTGIIPKLRYLTCFMHIYPISAADLEALASLPRLTYLECTLKQRSDPSKRFAHRPPGSPSFRALLELDLHLHSYKHVLNLLPYVNSSDLHSLKLHCDTTPTLKQTETLFASLATPSWPCPLRELSVSAPNESDADPTARTITLGMLRPLFALQLEVLWIDAFIVDVDDDGLEAMATAWSRLRTLNLGSFTGWGARHAPRATIRGLIPLIQHCPQISHIGYRMRTDIVNSGTWRAISRPGHGVVATQWIALHVGDSRIDNAVKEDPQLLVGEPEPYPDRNLGFEGPMPMAIRTCGA